MTERQVPTRKRALRHAAGSLAALASLAVLVCLGAAPGSAATAASPPTNTGEPSITGTPQKGHTLTAQPGSWSGTGPISFRYQWRRCNSSGGSCKNIRGADRQTHEVVSDDEGHTLRVLVTATNSEGSSTALSNAITIQRSGKPKNTAKPSISGNLTPGQTLTANPGAWTGTQPFHYDYDWRRCDANGDHCSSIRGATAQTYRLTTADGGHRLQVRVEASNTYGRTRENSRPTPVVQPNAPVSTSPPVISGTARQGETLKTTTGGWASTVGLAYYYQWARCDANGNNCAPIGNATRSSYTLTAADVGHRLIVQVKAVNSMGASYRNSAPTAVVASSPSTPAPPTAPGAVPVSSVSLPDRLVIDAVRFIPDRIRTRQQPLVLRVHVREISHGRSVAGARVYAVAVPFNRLSAAPVSTTDGTGWATLTFVVKNTFPLRKGYLVVMFVRASKPGENPLAGVSTRRLVSVRVG